MLLPLPYAQFCRFGFCEFQNFDIGDSYVLKSFSESLRQLMEREFNNDLENAGAIFPRNGKMTDALRKQIDGSIFYGASVELDKAGLRLKLVAYFFAIPYLLSLLDEVPLYTTILASNRSGYDDFSYEVEGPNGITYYATLTSLVRLLNYSNPAVSSNGYPTGQPWADNSKLMRNIACQVADNFQNKHFSLNVRQTSCSSLPMLLKANIGTPDPGVPGAGPYLVEWFFNGTLIGTGINLSIQQHYDCPFYFIECRVTSSDGLVIKKWHKIDLRAIYCLCRSVLPGGGGGGNGGGERSTADLGVAGIYPNPVTEGNLVLMVPELAKTTVNVSIHNPLGQIIANSNLPFDPFGYAYLDISEVPDGCYVLHINGTPKENLNFKFIVTKKQ